MVFSSSKEVDTLKKKIKQVSFVALVVMMDDVNLAIADQAFYANIHLCLFL